MPLFLSAVSDNRALLGDQQTKEFAACGGTIGRSQDNDWILPDPHRYVSGRHALIDFQVGAYYLIDTSHNGVFINDADEPVGRGHPQRIFDGDTLRFGEFEILAKVTEEENDVSDDGMGDSVVRAQLVPEDESVDIQMVDAGHLVDEEDLGRYLSPGDLSARHTQLSERMPTLMAHEASRDRHRADSAEQRAAALLLQAAGLNPKDIPGSSPDEILQTAGSILHTMVVGLTDLLNERPHLKAAFRFSQTATHGGHNNPLKFSPTVKDALKYLLGRSSDSYLPAKDAVRDSFQEVKRHEQAVPKALARAMKDFMAHLAPEELRHQFDHGLKRNSLLAVTNKVKYWDLYEESFPVLTRGDDSGIPEAFRQEFTQAYEQEVAALKSAARS
jgi:type VI secretion system protein ImpI